MVDPYQRQLAPQRTSGSVGFANAQQMGGGIGDVLSGIGDAVGENAIGDLRLKQQQERDLAAAAAFKAAAEVKERIGMASLDAQDNAAPGAAGFSQSMAEILDKETGAFVQSIADPQVRQRYEAQMSEWASEQRLRFEAFERGQTAKLGVTNTQQSFDLIANRVSRDAPAEDYDEAIEDIRTGLAEMEGLPADVRAGLEREGVAKVTYSWLAGKPPNQAKALLASGLFDGFLPPEAIDRLNNNADVEIRRAQVELEAQQRAQVAESREALNLLITQLGDGAVIPDGDLQAAVERATALGLDKQGYDLVKLGISNDVNRTYRAAPPAQIDAALKQLQADIATRGDDVPASLTLRRDALQSLLTARTRDAAADPLAVAAQNGIASGPIDWDNPATIAQRKTAALAAAKLLGVPPRLLTDEEATEMAANMKTPQGRAMAAQQLQQFGGREARLAAEQVAPSDTMFHYSLGLNRNARQLVYEGQALQQSGKVKVDTGEARRVWAERIAPATRELGQTATSATFEMATAIYAQAMDRRGETEFNEQLFRASINTALGGTTTGGQRKGGVGEWNGRAVVLPPSLTQADFERRLSGFRPTQAFHRNGAALTARELQDNYTPVMVGPNRYGFVSSRGEFVGTKKRGEIYTLDITKVQPPAPRAPRQRDLTGGAPRGSVIK